MKKLTALLFLFISIAAIAQQKPTDLDKSPADISYCPNNYPILKMNGKIATDPVARVIYSRPQKAGRVIFGGIVAYNQIWRLGANEATEIEFFRSVKIGSKTIPKGRYSMYAICTENKWTIIFNSEKDIWGLSYNAKKDVLHIDEPIQQTDTPVEAFTMYFDDAKNTSNLVILWDTIKVEVPVSY